MSSLTELGRRVAKGIRETSRKIKNAIELPTYEELHTEFPHAQNCERSSQLRVVFRKTYVEGSGAWGVGSLPLFLEEKEISHSIYAKLL